MGYLVGLYIYIYIYIYIVVFTVVYVTYRKTSNNIYKFSGTRRSHNKHMNTHKLAFLRKTLNFSNWWWLYKLFKTYFSRLNNASRYNNFKCVWLQLGLKLSSNDVRLGVCILCKLQSMWTMFHNQRTILRLVGYSICGHVDLETNIQTSAVGLVVQASKIWPRSFRAVDQYRGYFQYLLHGLNL